MCPRIPSEHEMELEAELSKVRLELRQLKRGELGLKPYDSSHCRSFGEHFCYDFEQHIMEAVLESPIPIIKTIEPKFPIFEAVSSPLKFTLENWNA